ncbi:hypothetical protein G7050_04710 [Dysgonomonas sp. HDW5A]|uniref:hypothetical protein n=1 Tax=Dysgonomonas sp. HDW5A TaxID=2714926 RepID=UPI00140A4AFB|nr:hypothetical protein [Dysgonomonas sp. HDW5A]QIK59181.1 hypothetical protein G7050_04710 [Dysgonomonas sp. HDW5A]
MQKLLILFVLIAIMSSCSGGDPLFKIDNPTSKTIKMEVDGSPVDITPGNFVEITLKGGEHTFKLIEGTAADGKSVVVYVYPESEGGIINPTLSDYVTVQALYVKDEASVKNFGVSNKKIIVDAKEYIGPFKLYNGFAIGKGMGRSLWKYDINEDLPDVDKIYDAGNGGNFQTKIFRGTDFVNFYKQEFVPYDGQPRELTEEEFALIEKPQLVAVNRLDSIDLERFNEHPQLKEAAGAYLEVIKKREASHSQSERQDLHKESVQLISKITQYINSSLPKNLHEAYNDLINSTSYNEEMGVRVKDVF